MIDTRLFAAYWRINTIVMNLSHRDEWQLNKTEIIDRLETNLLL